MKIIIAPNSFKNALDCIQAAKFIKEGIEESKLSASCILAPIADGGDDTLDVIDYYEHLKIRSVEVQNPYSVPIEAEYGISNETAYIEMSKASGLAVCRGQELNPLVASTFGTGELMLDAIKNGVKKIVIGLGGSATVDGGKGILLALGAKFYDEGDNQISDPNALLNVDSVRLDEVIKLCQGIQFIVLNDVNNPLLGTKGSAHFFGPQKGATLNKVTLLENSLLHWKELLSKVLNKDAFDFEGAGAAGGISFTFKHVFQAEMVSGFDYIATIGNVEDKIAHSDLVITAEGGADPQTLHGKGPAGIAEIAKQHAKPCVLLCGSYTGITELNSLFDAVFPINPTLYSVEKAIKLTGENLSNCSTQIGNLLSAHFPSKTA